MSTMSVIIVCIVVTVIILGLTIWITNKAYEVLPSVSKVDPHPDQINNETTESEKIES